MKKKKNIKYVYIDLDGTFLATDKSIPDQHLKVIKELKAKGIKVGIATGRPPYLFLDIIDKIKPNLPTVAINGNLIYYSPDKQESIKCLTKSQVKSFMAFAKVHKLNYLAYSDYAMYYKEHILSKHLQWIRDNSSTLPKKFQTPLYPLEVPPKNIYKFLITVKDNKNYDIKQIEDFAKSLKGTYLIKSQSGLLDLMPHNISKGSAMQYLEQKKIINLQETLCVGDSHNDITMLQAAGLSVVMANSPSAVKKYGDIITKKSNDQGGLMEVIDVIF